MTYKYILAAMIAVSLLTISATATTYDDFESGTYLLVPDGTMSPNGFWLNIWNGFGSSGVENINGNGMMFLEPAKAKGGSTRSTLVISTESFTDFDMSFDTRTVRQLKDRPRAWEVDWTLWHYKPLTYGYYFVHKTNGIELGKICPNSCQVFLYTMNTPQKIIGQQYQYRINQVGNHIQVWIDSQQVVDYIDTAMDSNYIDGAMGLYTEDARVNFDNVNITRY